MMARDIYGLKFNLAGVRSNEFVFNTGQQRVGMIADSGIYVDKPTDRNENKHSSRQTGGRQTCVQLTDIRQADCLTAGRQGQAGR